MFHRTTFICLLIVIIISFSCKKNPEQKKAVYDPKIVILEKVKIPFQKDLLKYHSKKFPSKISSAFLKVDRDSIRDIISPGESSFVLGERRVYNFKISLLSDREAMKGFLALIDRDSVQFKLTVYENHFFGERFLDSYLCDNYIIIYQYLNHDSDIVSNGEESKTEYYYAVVDITKKGEMIILNEIKAHNVIDKYNLRP